MRLTNEAGASLTHIVLSFTGGVRGTPALAHEAVFATSIRVTADSGLALSYDGQDGVRRTEAIGVYLEPQSTGEIVLRIDESGAIRLEDRLRIALY